MKKAGIIGGTGPESTIDYYQSIITEYQERKGTKEDLPELIINSINMYRIFKFLENGDQAGLIDYLVTSVQTLERAGADFAILSANTPHIVFDAVQERVDIPMISIVEETYRKAEDLGLRRVGLLGTKFTMENDFFKESFLSRGIDVVVPEEKEQQMIHEKIVRELENGIVNDETKKEFQYYISRMVENDSIEGVILGCTELPLLLKKEDVDGSYLDTVAIHVNRIVDNIMEE